MPVVTVDTEQGQPVNLYYEDHGQGRPVVLVHGWPLSGRSWEAQVAPLVEAGHRVVTYDRRGFGESDKPWEGYDYYTLADDLDDLLTALELRDVALVGFSMRGGEVVRYLTRHGSKGVVTRAVLAAAVPPYLHKTDNNPDGGLDDGTIASFRAGVTGDRLAFLDGFVEAFYTPAGGIRSKELVSEAQHAYALQIAALASPRATLACIAAFGETDFRADVAAVSVPTLVVHGSADQVVPFAVSGERSHKAIAGSELVVVDGAPHGLNVTHAHEFNKALLGFLAA